MTKKKYKNGLCLMKAYPLHLGHLHLINTAIENCENVHVMVCYNSSQYIPGDLRYKAIKEIYKNNKNVFVYLSNDQLMPQYESEVDNLDIFYKSFWVPFVYQYIEELDVVFTSEDYGDDFARYLGIDHFLVDKDRDKYKISGTKIRQNPYDNWDFIPDEMKPFFIKRIALMGPESVGKSELTKKLAEYYNTNYVEEYGRTVYEENGNKIDLEDFIKISIGRQKMENERIVKSNRFLFCDTEDITTYIFSKMFFPDDYKEIEDFFMLKIKKKQKYDLYILLKPDVDGIQDGTRCFLNERVNHYNEIKQFLIDRKCYFIEIGGNWENRYNESIENINLIFN